MRFEKGISNSAFPLPASFDTARGWAAEDMERSVMNVVIWMFECFVCARTRLTGTTCSRLWSQVLEPSYHLLSRIDMTKQPRCRSIS